MIKERIKLSNLRDISLNDKELIEKLSALSPSQSCENAFATIFMWSGAYNTKLLNVNEESVFVYNPIDGILHYTLGKDISPETLANYVHEFDKAGMLHSKFVYNIPPNWLEKYPDAEKYFTLVNDPADEDYIYELAKLSTLSGAKLRKKRNHIKRFLANNPNFHIENANAQNISEIWNFIKKVDTAKGLITELQASAKAIKYFDTLSLEGIVLRDGNGEILGTAIFSRISPDTYTIHFEKSKHDVEGAPQMLVKIEADSLLARGAKYMNREQDLGDANLRHAKNSLDPIAKYKRLRAYLK